MVYEFLKPVGNNVIEYIEQLPTHAIGKNVDVYVEGKFPNLEDVKIAILAVNDSRGEQSKEKNSVNFDIVRKNFYALFPGNWSSKIVDLGTLEAGKTIEDTYFAVKKIVSDLLKKNILPIIIGASQDITYAVYRAYDEQEQMVNLTSIDSKIDVVNDVSKPSESFISRIILEEPNNLINFCNLGYQTYFNSQEELDLLDKMFFEAYRLGEIITDITIAEPILRDSDIVSLDIHSVRSMDLGINNVSMPNGFDGREICSLARYSGISDRVSSFGIFNICEKSQESLLISQILWYFIEGYNYRLNEYPYVSKKSYIKYTVLLEEQELVFYKSDVSDRWWIEIEYPQKDMKVQKMLFPCSYVDYQKAQGGELPERWWRVSRKMLV